MPFPEKVCHEPAQESSRPNVALLSDIDYRVTRTSIIITCLYVTLFSAEHPMCGERIVELVQTIFESLVLSRPHHAGFDIVITKL